MSGLVGKPSGERFFQLGNQLRQVFPNGVRKNMRADLSVTMHQLVAHVRGLPEGNLLQRISYTRRYLCSRLAHDLHRPCGSEKAKTIEGEFITTASADDIDRFPA